MQAHIHTWHSSFLADGFRPEIIDLFLGGCLVDATGGGVLLMLKADGTAHQINLFF